MTLKYESEILFDLMKRDGDDTPSDVLPYESELKEKYLNQVVGAYPKLQDYRPEWLNYNLYHHLPSDFPVESVTNVTSASFHDVVPYSYGSAILKGQTLVNLLDYSHSYSKNFTKQSNGHWTISVNNNSGTLHLYIPLNQPLKDKTLYTIIVDITKNNLSKEMRLINGFTTGNAVDVPLGYIGKLKLTFTTNSATAKGWNGALQTVMTTGTTGEIEFGDYILLEGDYTNVDIPYFEGMTSVKMPVLTTTGKNLLNEKTITIGYISSTGEEKHDKANAKYEYTRISPNTTYYGYNFGYDKRIQISWYDSNKTFLNRVTCYNGASVISPSNAYYARVHGQFFEYNRDGNDFSIVQMMFSTEPASSYEPYKSNILTVNEDVELGSVGDVRDELDLLTGDVISRTGLYTYKGEIEPYFNQSIGGYVVNVMANANVTAVSGIISDKFINRTFTDYDSGVYGNNNGAFYFFDKLVTSAQEFKEKYIGTNFRFKLKEKSIKTVDLTCINEQGENETLRPIEGTMHVSTSSQTLPPLLDMSVPVEATSQNLMSFANIVEEEK